MYRYDYYYYNGLSYFGNTMSSHIRFHNTIMIGIDVDVGTAVEQVL